MTTCTVCGYENADGVEFCGQCGNELSSQPLVDNYPTSEPISVPVTITPEAIEIEGTEVPPTLVPPIAITPSISVSRSPILKAKLTAKAADSPIKEYILDETPLLVGKFDPDTEIVDIDLVRFPDAELISRNHAELSFDGSSWQVRDLNSTNGTYLKRGAERAFKITQPETVHEGDRLSFANIVFTFSILPED